MSSVFPLLVNVITLCRWFYDHNELWSSHMLACVYSKLLKLHLYGKLVYTCVCVCVCLCLCVVVYVWLCVCVCICCVHCISAYMYVINVTHMLQLHDYTYTGKRTGLSCLNSISNGESTFSKNPSTHWPVTRNTSEHC